MTHVRSYCFEDCLYYSKCEHHEPNFCGIAAVCRGFPFCDESCPDCHGEYWIYPTEDDPTAGYQEQPRLKCSDLSEEEREQLKQWRELERLRDTKASQEQINTKTEGK